jgi:type VI secretion system protein ImpM
MRCGLYGKLPAKRDFIAIGASREFLNAWEPWMQGGISASRVSLGADWQNTFLTAPIWRFWLGADICGTTITGAFMSSLDGVGRYFPLTLFAGADRGAAIPPPELDSQDEWFAGVEDFLMSTLDQDAQFDSITAALDQISPPAGSELASAPEATPLRDAGAAASPAEGHAFSEMFDEIRVNHHANVYSAATFWWTIGGEGFQPMAVSRRHMPDPSLFAAMLTGNFVPPSE